MKAKAKLDVAKTEASYPLYDLEEGIKIADAVRDLGGGNAPVSRSLLAQHLQYAENGPSFFQRVASAKAFGLIDGRGSYSLTELGRQYLFPTVENGQEAAAVKILSFPKAFSILVNKFDGGKLPTNDMIGNIIHAEADIPISKKNVLAGCFNRSAQFIGAIDNGGFLRCKALVAGSVNSGVVPAKPTAVEQNRRETRPDMSASVKSFEEAPGTKTYELPLDRENKRCVKLNAPLDITQKEVQRIAKWLDVQLLIEDNH